MNAEFGTRLEDLNWIDAFARSIRPYVRVRVEDRVLIKMPVEAHPLNETAAKLLSEVLAGRSIRRVARRAGAADRPERIAQIHALFCDVRDLVRGDLVDADGRRATSVDEFTGSFTRYPVLSELALSYACNQSCRFCYAGCAADHVPESGDGLTTRQARRLIDRIALDAHVPSISFTGGEPSLRADLPRLVSHARRREMRVNLITNGTGCASRDYVRRLSRAGLNSAQVSIEGPDAPTHDGLTGRPGSFDRALRAVSNLRDAGIHVHTNSTLSAPNIAMAEGIVDLAARLGLERVSMNLIIPNLPPESTESIHVRYRDAGDHILRARDRAARRRIAFHWYSPLPFCVFNPVAHGLGNKGCAACDGLLHVAPTGDVLPCSSFPLSESVGNLLHDDFDSIWFGRQAQFYKHKEMAPDACRDCEYLALCQGACTLYWRRMGTLEISERRASACL